MMSNKLLALALVTITACVGDVPPDSGSTTNPGGSTTNPGGPGDQGTNPGGSTMTLAAYFTGLGHDECDQAFACKSTFPTANGTFADAFGPSASACYSDAASYYDVSSVQAEITAGKITFDGAAAATCINGITQSTDCAGYWANGPTNPAACNAAIIGHVADGAACTIDFDCTNLASVCDATKHTCGAAAQARSAPIDGLAPRYARLLRLQN